MPQGLVTYQIWLSGTGLVIAVEPMVNMGTKKVRPLPDYWTQSTADGKYSAHFEHTIAMTEDGPWALTADPQGGEEEETTGVATNIQG